MAREFITARYIGSDGDDFRKEFVEYLRYAVKCKNWNAMSDYQLYLDGAYKAIEEIIEEIERV